MTALDVGGDEVQTPELAVEGEPRAVGDLPGGIGALGRLSCGHCAEGAAALAPA